MIVTFKNKTSKCYFGYAKKEMSMRWKCHNHTLETNPWHHEEEEKNNKRELTFIKQ